MIRARSPAQYLLGVAVGLDQLLNAILFGDPHATVSSRAHLAMRRRKRWACVLCGLLDRIEPGHCRAAWEKELAAARARLAAEASPPT